MTYEEAYEAVEALLDEGETAAGRAEKVLRRVPAGDVIIGELYARFSEAADAFEEARGSSRDLGQIITAAAKVRDTSLAWARYVEAAAAQEDKG